MKIHQWRSPMKITNEDHQWRSSLMIFIIHWWSKAMSHESQSVTRHCSIKDWENWEDHQWNSLVKINSEDHHWRSLVKIISQDHPLKSSVKSVKIWMIIVFQSYENQSVKLNNWMYAYLYICTFESLYI